MADEQTAQSLAVSFRDNTLEPGKFPGSWAQKPENLSAIKAFQTAAGIPADGIIGPQTKAAYAKYAGVPATGGTSAGSKSSAPVAYVPPTSTLASKVSLPALPITLGIALLALGAGFAVYRATK